MRERFSILSHRPNRSAASASHASHSAARAPCSSANLHFTAFLLAWNVPEATSGPRASRSGVCAATAAVSKPRSKPRFRSNVDVTMPGWHATTATPCAAKARPGAAASAASMRTAVFVFA